MVDECGIPVDPDKLCDYLESVDHDNPLMKGELPEDKVVYPTLFGILITKIVRNRETLFTIEESLSLATAALCYFIVFMKQLTFTALKNYDEISNFFISCRIVFFENKIYKFFNYCYFYISKIIFFFIPVYLSFFFKLAVAPFHFWAPEVYEYSPNSSVFFFSVIAKIGVIVVMLRFFNTMPISTSIVNGLINSFSVLSSLMGSLVNVDQRKLKSLLVYSSTSHIGFLFLPFGIKNLEGIQMLLFYVFIYVFSGLVVWSIFMVVRFFQYYTKHNKDLTFFSLIFKKNTLTAIILILIFFSFAGLPPLMGFLSKINIFLIIIKNKMFYISAILAFFSTIATFYYLRMIKIISFEPLLNENLYELKPINKTNIICILIFSFIAWFFSPNEGYAATYELAVLLIR